MAKSRRYNEKKIASTPLLKKQMAAFCAQFDVAYCSNKDAILQTALFKGHRGYVSYSDKDLAKEFDKRIEMLRDKYSLYKKSEDERKVSRGKYYYEDNKFVEVTIFYEEGVRIANEVFEEEFLK